MFEGAWKTLWYTARRRVEPESQVAHQKWTRQQHPRKTSRSADRQAIYERDGGLCWICGKPVDAAEFVLDHVWPKVHGGDDDPSNLSLAHRPYNLERGDP